MKRTVWVLLVLGVAAAVGLGAYVDRRERQITMLTTLLNGTWAVKNKTVDSTYSGYAGQVTFSGDRIILDSGRFAAAGLIHESENASGYKIPLDPITYTVLGRLTLYVMWTSAWPDGTGQSPQDALITITRVGRDNLVMVGQGGSGTIKPKVSYLERIP